MARLISYDYIRQKALADPDSGEAIVYLQDIAEAPTVDAVEVVRCEFCKNAEPYDCTFHGTVHHLYKCKKDEGAIGYKKVVSSNDFCSYGERKDGDMNV